MGINKQTDEQAEIQIGPTELGMVRFFVRGEAFEIPMDFTPDEAQEIAAEIEAAAALARENKAGKR